MCSFETTAATASQMEIDGRKYLSLDSAMAHTYELVRSLAKSSISVLITGETGAGKEHVAHALHRWSMRAAGPFLVFNCAAIPEQLVESELFGHRKGAFTGASEHKRGLLAAAAGGTVFLDEVGDLSAAAQAKLLRAIEGGYCRAVGDLKEQPTDIRLVAATNKDLDHLARKGTFRLDLFFRLRGASVEVPPLRSRPNDILPLARHFLAEACLTLRRPSMRISQSAAQILLFHDWTGNVRELKNAMELIAATCKTQEVQSDQLQGGLRRPECLGPDASAADLDRSSGRFRPIHKEVEELERRRIVEALDAAHGVQTRAAKLIDMPIRTFVEKVRKYGLRAQRSGGRERA